MKRILLPFLFLSSAVFAHPEQIIIRHPQADINYYCQRGYSVDECIEIACSYATQYSCKVIGQIQNTYYIESYVPPDYRPPVVVVTPPIVYNPPPIIWWFPIDRGYRSNNHHDYRHRPRRR